MSEDNEFRVMIAESHSFKNFEFLCEKCDLLLAKKSRVTIICGESPQGTSYMGEQYAKRRGFKLESFPAKYGEFGKSAPYRRADEMIDKADGAILFWDRVSEMGKYIIEESKKKNLNIRVYEFQAEFRQPYVSVESQDHAVSRFSAKRFGG